MITYLLGMLKARKGQGMTEYALIIGLVALVVMAAVTLFQQELSALFDRIRAALAGV